MTKRHDYSKAFKLEAVRLLAQAGKPVTQIAKELGVRRTLLYSWRDAYRKKGDAAFPGSGRRPASEESELIRLRRELKQVTLERDILKKVEAYFTKVPK